MQNLFRLDVDSLSMNPTKEVMPLAHLYCKHIPK